MKSRSTNISTYLPHAEFVAVKEAQRVKEANKYPAVTEFNNGKILDEYGNFLQKQEWDFFATYTTRQALTLPAARRMMEKYAIHIGCGGNTTFVNRQIPGKEFDEPAQVPGTGRAKLFWAAEPFKLRNSYHLHALVKCDMNAKQVDAYWQKKFGFARIKDYDGSKPGAHYVAKYMTKELSDYDLHL